MTGAEQNHNGDERLWARVRPEPQGRGRCCPDALELAGYVDGRLEEDARETVEAHLAECEQCLQAVADTRTLAVVAAPATMIERGRALVGPAEASQRGLRVLARIGRAVAWPMAAAASVAVCVAGYRVGAGVAAAVRPGDPVLAEMTFGVFGGDSVWLADEFLPPASLEDLP